MSDAEWTHNELANDLARSKLNDRRMVWEDMQLGPSGSVRPDVFTIEKSYTNPKPTVYEVKVSRSDFLADVTAGKYLSYFGFASQLYFACPDGLLKRSEVPEGCGLIVRKDQVWRAVKRATVHKISLPEEVALKLLIDGTRRLTEPTKPQPRLVHAWEIAKSDRLRLSKSVAEVVRDLDHARSMVEYYQKQKDALCAEINNLHVEKNRIEREAILRADEKIAERQKNIDNQIAELCSIFGIEPSLPGLRFEINRRAVEVNRDDEVKKLRRAIDGVDRALCTAKTTAKALAEQEAP